MLMEAARLQRPPVLPEDIASWGHIPGIQTVAVHPDLRVVESNRLHGNTDPRFGNVAEVVQNRAALAATISCKRLVVMVAQGKDKFLDLDRGKITPARDGYRLWPTELQPETYTYDPEDPPYMADIPGDGLITQQENVGLAAFMGDCAPAVIYDPVARVLGVPHVGRRGAELDIASQMVRYMRDTHGAVPQRIIVYFGPSIAPGSYVLEYLNDALLQEAWRPFLSETKGGYKTDIVGYAAQCLMQMGVSPGNITRSLVDVRKHPDYFSYIEHKKEGVPDGRNGFMAAIQPQEREQ